MCGRYAASRGADYLAGHFEVDEVEQDEPGPDAPAKQPGASWNVAPTDRVHVVTASALPDGAVRRTLRVCRWGLVPSWATDAKGAARLINARRETVATSPTFRAAYARRRCLVPADGYYEWQRVGGGKQPWYLTRADGQPLAMAGVGEVWRDPAGALVRTVAVLTTDAPEELAAIHDRTPVVLDRSDWARWLDPSETDPADLLGPGRPGLLDAWQVGPEVGNVRHDGPGLVLPR